MTTGQPDPSLAHVLGRLNVLESRVRRAVARRRESDPTADDPLRGLYLTDDDVAELLKGQPGGRPMAFEPTDLEELAALDASAVASARVGGDLRLLRLALTFGLEELDVELLMVAVAPDLDARFEKLYGYLNDDVTRRRATVGLALDIACTSPLVARARSRFSGGAPLVVGGLVVLEDDERPFLTRGLRVPDRVTGFLLGDDGPDAALLGLLGEKPPPLTTGAPLAAALATGASLAYLRERPGSAGRSTAVDALTRLDKEAVLLDLAWLAPREDLRAVAEIAGREARLLDAGLVAGPVDELVRRGPEAVRCFAELSAMVVLTGRESWDPAWSTRVPVLLDAPVPSEEQRRSIWTLIAGENDEVDTAGVTAQFRLAPENVVRSLHAARLNAALSGTPLAAVHVLAGARGQNGGGLERLARRIEPSVSWEDLVVTESVLSQLQELAARASNRTVVLDTWGMRPGGGRGRGVNGLFAGDPGTGKTMAAEVIANALGLDLYAVNLATVVDKYIGETEKNLERIFSDAEGVNGVILFDEADALFGKRSEVSDAHDRHANIEVAYLLQRMESFDGLAILATNLRANLDEAFARRLDVIVDFALPDEGQRRVLWDRCLGPHLPRGDDLDLDFCARNFELSGGNIRSIAVTAAFRAAAGGHPVDMADLMTATQAEYRKLGRLVLAAEFGDWSPAAAPGDERLAPHGAGGLAMRPAFP